MLPSRLNNFIRGNSVAGVECIITSDGEARFNYCILEVVKTKLILKENGSNLSSVDEVLFKISDTSLPVCMSIDGKGILHKKVILSPDEKDRDILAKILPNGDPNQFYIQKHVDESFDGNSLYVSVIRKETLDKILSAFEEKKIYVVDCFLGPFSIHAIFPMMEKANTDVLFGKYNLQMNNGLIADFSKDESEIEQQSTSITLGSEKINSSLIVSYASGFKFLVKKSGEPFSPIAKINKNQVEFKQKQIFKMTGIAALSFFFFLLLVNFFLFQHYNSKSVQLNEKSLLTKSNLETYSKMRKQLSEKEDFFQKTGLLKNARTSFYADRIAADLPEAISLADLNILPALKSINDEKEKISFQASVIKATGVSQKSNDLSKWISVLKEKEWIQAVNILEYKQNSLIEPGQFLVEIVMK